MSFTSKVSMYLTHPCQQSSIRGQEKEEKEDIQIIQPQQRNSIINIKPQSQSPQKILSLLQGSRISREPRIAQLNRLVLDIHPHLQLQVLAQRRVDFGPGRFDRGEPVRRHGDFAGFDVDETV